MAALSNSRKVAMLESAVLSNDPDHIRNILAEYSPIEFTARALGIAFRIGSAETVAALLDGGATLSFEDTPNLKRKYACVTSISNYASRKVDYSLWLFPCHIADGAPTATISDAERVRILHLLSDRNAADMSELLYHAILYGDDALYSTLQKLQHTRLSPYRAMIVSGSSSHQHLDAIGRFDRFHYIRFLCNTEPDALHIALERFTGCMESVRFSLFPSELDYHVDSAYRVCLHEKLCDERLFMFFARNSDLLDRIDKWTILKSLLSHNNASGLSYVLSLNWIATQEECKLLIETAQSHPQLRPEITALLLACQKQFQPADTPHPDDALSLEPAPLTPAELKKIWPTKKQEDGTLIITSYKGEDIDVVIPEMIGKAKVTAVAAGAFHPDAGRLTEVQRANRRKIQSITYPGSIREIPSFAAHPDVSEVYLGNGVERISDSAFLYCRKLKTIDLPDSVASIGKKAFSGSGLESITIPDSVHTLEAGAFEECTALSSVTLPDMLENIPANAFKLCKALTDLRFPSSLITIGSLAFSDSGLRSISLPDTLEVINTSAFSGCADLVGVSIPEGVKINAMAFHNCTKLADEKGRIIVNGALHGFNGSWTYLQSEEYAVKPLILDNSITSVAIYPSYMPAITCREYTGPGEALTLPDPHPGDELYFGRFPLTTDYVMQPLKWRVLTVEDNWALLITADRIISANSQITQLGVWANTVTRTFLNEGFLHTAFTPLEQEQILLTTLRNQPVPSDRSSVAPDTEDRVFLLSLEEVLQYMPEQSMRQADITAYADKQYIGRANDYWMLRTPNKDGSNGTGISSGTYGFVQDGYIPGNHFLRPCIRVRIR